MASRYSLNTSLRHSVNIVYGTKFLNSVDFSEENIREKLKWIKSEDELPLN